MSSTPESLDRIDHEILVALQNNARLSNKELAARIGLAPSSCLERVRRLEATGALRTYHAAIDPGVVGIGLQALVFVRLRRHSRLRVEAFRTYALELAETVGLFHVTGEFDFLVRIAVRDADHLRNLLMDAFTSRPEVAHLETHLIFESVTKPVLPRLVEPRIGSPAATARSPRRIG